MSTSTFWIRIDKTLAVAYPKFVPPGLPRTVLRIPGCFLPGEKNRFSYFFYKLAIQAGGVNDRRIVDGLATARFNNGEGNTKL